MTWFGVKWPKKGWYALKQNNQPTNQPIQLNDQALLFQTIQFSMSHLYALSLNVKNSSIWPIDRTLSGATTASQSRPGSNGNEGVLCFPQSSSITETLPSHCFVSYSRRSLLGGGLCFCRDAVDIFYSSSSLGSYKIYKQIVCRSYCYILTLDRAVNQKMHLSK